MKQKSFIIDPNLCLGCRSCQTACAANRDLPPGIFWRRVNRIEYASKGQVIKYFLTSACYQCENPECIRLCPQKACRKRQDGIIIFNANKCDGCGICVKACPFEAPVTNPVTGIPSKCDFCYQELDKGESPFCVDACPVGALALREFSPDEAEADADLVSTLPGFPKIQLTRPSVRFHSLKLGRQVFRNRND